MDTQHYLHGVLDKYAAEKIEMHDPRLSEVKSIVKSWGGKNLKNIHLTGANNKRTAINESTDCDLLVSLKDHEVSELPNLYKSLEYEFLNYGIKPSRHTNSIFLESNGLKIEVIPAVFKNGTLNYHCIYYEPIKQILETNVSLHDNHVLDSRHQNEIKLIKIWRRNHQLKFPTLFLELSVLKALNHRSSSSLTENFRTILKHLEENILHDVMVDLANSNHKVSELISIDEKISIKEAAAASLLTESIESVIW